MEKKNKTKLYAFIVIAILLLIDIAQSVQIAKLDRQIQYQQEINIELNEKITLLAYERDN